MKVSVDDLGELSIPQSFQGLVNPIKGLQTDFKCCLKLNCICIDWECSRHVMGECFCFVLQCNEDVCTL